MQLCLLKLDIGVTKGGASKRIAYLYNLNMCQMQIIPVPSGNCLPAKYGRPKQSVRPLCIFVASGGLRESGWNRLGHAQERSVRTLSHFRDSCRTLVA